MAWVDVTYQEGARRRLFCRWDPDTGMVELQRRGKTIAFRLPGFKPPQPKTEQKQRPGD